MDYKTLDSDAAEIRLLKILPPLPGTNIKTDTIRCEVIHVKLLSSFLNEGHRPTPPSKPAVTFHQYIPEGLPKELFIPPTEEEIALGGGGSDAFSMGELLNVIENEELGSNFRMNVGWEDEDGDSCGSPAELRSRSQARKKEKEPEGLRFKWGEYVALSYTWGSPDKTKTILLNGYEHQATTNLELALRELRNLDYFKKGGKIWIDALCINQSSVSERNSQVQMMATIYRQAANIIVYLGPSSYLSDKVILWLEQMSVYYRTSYLEALDDEDPMTAHAHRERAHVKLRYSLQTAVAGLSKNSVVWLKELAVPLYEFFTRPYWRRLWIIQELCMGREEMGFLCGSRVTTWKYIRDSIFILNEMNDEVLKPWIIRALKDEGRDMKEDSAISHLAQIAQLEIQGHRKVLKGVDGTLLPVHSTPSPGSGPLPGTALMRAIRLAAHSHATNRKDRVYGLLAIPGLPNLNIQVDYSKDLRDIFKAFAVACIERGSLEIFELLDGMTHNPHCASPLPSWVPSLNKQESVMISPIKGTWHASGWNQGFVLPGPNFILPEVVKLNDNVIQCYGFECEKIEGLGGCHPDDIEHVDFGKDFVSGTAQSKVPVEWREGKDFAGSEKVEEHIWYTLVGGTDASGSKRTSDFECLLRGFEEKRPPDDSPHLRNWKFINANRDLEFLGRPLSSYFWPPKPTANPPPIDLQNMAKAQSAMQARTRSRRLATTTAGFLALVPITTQPGDVVLILIGHGKPVIAREIGWFSADGMGEGSKEKEKLYMLIGEAFVSGLMMWEGMRRDIYSGEKVTRRCLFY